jgi:hypothetical protein
MIFRRSTQVIFAAIAAAFPIVVEVAITCVWWDRPPDLIATTFGPDGSPTGYGTPLGTAILIAALQALFLAAAIGSAVARDRRKLRIACAVTAGLVAALGTSWLIIAGLASSSLSSVAWWLGGSSRRRPHGPAFRTGFFPHEGSERHGSLRRATALVGAANCDGSTNATFRSDENRVSSRGCVGEHVTSSPSEVMRSCARSRRSLAPGRPTWRGRPDRFPG